jgi:Putative restriction endonuclease
MERTTQLTTFAEFEALPDELCRDAELLHGELVQLAEPDQVHVWIQQRLMRLLDRRADVFGVAGMEMPFRPHGDNEYYRVDVAFVSAAVGFPDGRAISTGRLNSSSKSYRPQTPQAR